MTSRSKQACRPARTLVTWLVTVVGDDFGSEPQRMPQYGAAEVRRWWWWRGGGSGGPGEAGGDGEHPDGSGDGE